MTRNFDPNFYKNNRTKLINSIKSDALVLTANGLMQSSMDQTLPFRQDSNFWYLTGLNEPDFILVITQQEEYLIIPDHYVSRENITAFMHKDKFKKISAIEQILDHKEGWKKLKDLLGSSDQIATTLPSPELIKHYGIYANPARRSLLRKIKRLEPKIAFEDLRPVLATLRMTKQQVEIDAIKKATDITLQSLTEVLNKDSLSKYKDTREIEQAILAGFKKNGGDGHGFEPVIAGGANAALFHFAELGLPINRDDLLYCDVGSSFGMYASDITRTVALNKPTSRQLEVFEAVKTAQTQARKLIKPGIKLKEYEIEVEQIIGEHLIKLGLINDLERKSIRKYYPHLCSHSLGLDIHDATNWDKPVPENMVMTVEPGIYILEEGIGVRIEDIVLVTKEGNELLSGSLGSSL